MPGCLNTRGSESLLKIGNDVINVLNSNRNANEILLIVSYCSCCGFLVARTSVTPELAFSSSESCSWVVVQGLLQVSKKHHHFAKNILS